MYDGDFPDPSLLLRSIGQGSHIWGRELTSDGLSFTAGSSPSLLLTRSSGWQSLTIEGPTLVRNGTTYYLFYGANSYESASSGIGYATPPHFSAAIGTGPATGPGWPPPGTREVRKARWCSRIPRVRPEWPSPHGTEPPDTRMEGSDPCGSPRSASADPAAPVSRESPSQPSVKAARMPGRTRRARNRRASVELFG